MGEFVKEQLIESLRNHDMRIVFQKRSGEMRDMLCTLKENSVPETKGTRVVSTEDLLIVYDLERKGWRSFYVDSVQSVKVAD